MANVLVQMNIQTASAVNIAPRAETDAAIEQRLETPLDNEAMPKAGTEAADVEHATPAVFGLDATVFVSLSMLVVIGIVLWKKVPAMIGGSLDKQIAAIRAQLDEAKQLREESEELRAKYEARLKAADVEAADILAQAEKEAQLVVANVKQSTTELIARRQKMAEDKIAAAERSAIADVRAKAANVATAAAASLIAANHDAAADQDMVNKAIGSLGKTLN